MSTLPSNHTRPASNRTGTRLLALLPVLLLAGLVAMQIQQAFARIGVLRDRQRLQFLNAVERMNAEVASAVEGDIARGSERAKTLAEVLLNEQGDARAREALMERYRQSSQDCVGAAALSDVSPLEDVEWRASEQVLLFRASLPKPLPTESGASGVELTLQAAPFLARVELFQPIEGVGNALVDFDGRVVAVDEVASGLGLARGQKLAARYSAEILSEVQAGEPRVRAQAARLFVSAVGPDGRLFQLVSVVTDAALAVKAEPAQHEARAIVLVTLLSTGGLALAGLMLHRANVRERGLRERSRALEHERALAERLATSERLSALGLLTAGVAHEINNPLEGIGNYLSLLGEEGLPATKRAEFLERIAHGLERIRVIVRDLLGFARPGARSGLFDLRAAVVGALDLARLAPDVKGCELVLEGLDASADEASAVALVQGDLGGIEQVILNLLLNAGRATGEAGRLVVALTREGAEHVLRVEDDGVGIDAEDLPRVFDPFFTRASRRGGDDGAESTEGATEGGGTGLGLSISYSIVQSHGGRLLAANRREGGACFEVRLPVAAGDSGSDVATGAATDAKQREPTR